MDIENKMLLIEQEYKNNEIDQYTVPAGPDSSKFREVVSGMVRFKKNFHSSSGYGTDFAYAMQIGTGISLTVRSAIKNKVYAIPHEGYYFRETHGTSFCVYGFVRKNQEEGA